MRKMLIFIILTFTFTVFFLPFTFELQDAASVSTITGPRSWPLFLLSFLLVLTILLLIKTIVDQKKGRFEENFDNEKEDADAELPPASAQNKNQKNEKTTEENGTWFSKYRHFILFGATLFYVVLMPFTGFMVATIIFIALTAFILGANQIRYITLATVAGSSLIFIVFDYLLGIPLP